MNNLENNPSKIDQPSEELLQLAEKHLQDILSFAIQHAKHHAAVVVYDTNSTLSITLTEAYRRCLPTAKFIDFYTETPANILAYFETLAPNDLVVLIQSTSFRLDAFRLRIELFQRSLKVIEHPHLIRMVGLETKYYIESLAYDPVYFRTTGNALKNLIDSANRAIINSGDALLIYDCALEPAKLNVGDYTQMKNIGGQFPIGEVFTEATHLEAVNGHVNIFCFGDATFTVNKPERPITLIIKNGRVDNAINSTPAFDLVLANIRADEGEVWVRELGFGLNKAFSVDRVVRDIGTYERVCGVHLSLGAKHSVCKKPHFKGSNTWHHVDVFVSTQQVILDDKVVYENQNWTV